MVFWYICYAGELDMENNTDILKRDNYVIKNLVLDYEEQGNPYQFSNHGLKGIVLSHQQTASMYLINQVSLPAVSSSSIQAQNHQLN